MTTAAPVSALKKTPMHAQHAALGAKLIDFGGWHMPVQYATGILDEHKTVREAVGLFDVSHMGEVRFRGPRAGEAVQRVVTNDVGKLSDNAAMYTCTLRPTGGIVDDCIVYRYTATDYLIVVNASNVEKDYAHFVEHASPIASVTNESEEWALLAVQGPKAIALVGELLGKEGVPPKPFTMTRAKFEEIDAPVTVCRTGYTGEDGVEILVGAPLAPSLWDLLLEEGKAHGIKPIGLGARDTLRLEARLCLYGNDIDEEHTPLEAGLGWVVKGKGFVGEEALARQKAEGVKRSLVGFRIDGRGIARHGYPILDGEGGAAIGVVTSGTVAPTVGGAVGMGYVPVERSQPGTRLTIDCRGKTVSAEIVKGPFYKRPQG